MMTLSLPMPKQTSILAQALAALFGGVLVFLGVVLLWVVGYQLYYAGRIFPGVSVAGVDLSGLAPQNAAFKLSQNLTYPIGGKVVFKNGDKIWSAAPVQLGMVFDASASAQAAYGLGRGGGLLTALNGQIRARGFGDDVAPVIIFDQRVAYKYLQGLAQEVNQPSVEASLHLDGASVVAQAGQSGRAVDVELTLNRLSGQLQSFRDGEVPLVIQELKPDVTDVSAQAETARQILSQPLQLLLPNPQVGDPPPWVYEAPVLANMITLQQVQDSAGTKLQLGLNPVMIRKMLAEIADHVNQPAANPRFNFDEATGQLVLLPGAEAHSKIGRSLDLEASATAITQALLAGQHSVALVIKETQPAVSENATAKELGITRLLPNGVQTSYFWGSHAERVHNIQTAAARFDGVLVAPGETFSMGETLGDVSLDNGFTEALIIYGGHTIKGVGGGVCQVSTTLFRTVFQTGFPVVERVPHAYRVSYYEETSSGETNSKYAGLDATVYFPLVDFKFTNDSAYWILMETSVDLGSQSLTWKFYSTYDGRTVQWDTTGPTNIVPAPAALFKENPDVSHITQTDYAANGADVDVTRTVMKNGSAYFQDEFKTHYEPWQAVCEYPRGTDNPEKAAKRQNPPLCQPPQT
jgi:vancomycin resistance protein YoaR